ncbi:hypothetical protein H072_670 [Dactylellina haptotyla CBS 200.50]|uniref:Uncharacterized protein n=1 Tax=Dactylellina haptotyla (strain CBS 200.50) TaxID=1284197 RepID=S8AR28_DACHA|nr:hypothetical protein H072_670 [Dactylellina haptotyla CBS 200.50]
MVQPRNPETQKAVEIFGLHISPSHRIASPTPAKTGVAE